VPNNRKTALRQQLIEAQQELREVLDRVEPGAWISVHANEGWTVRDLLTHLTTAETGFVGTIRRMAAGQGGVPADFDANRWNAGQLRRRGEASSDELRSELEKSHEDMLALLDGLDDAALDHRGYLSSGAEGSTEDNVLLVISHKREHTSHIRSALNTAAQG
jgi:uncharacterized damage-inducible protein DinB